MTPINRCPKCHGVIQYAVGPTGKSVEVNPDGTDHSCLLTALTNGTNTEPIIATTAAVNQPARMNGRPVIVEHETVIKNVAVRPDSLELGTPGKSGCIKIYFDASDVAGTVNGSGTPLHCVTLSTPLICYPTPIAQGWDGASMIPPAER